MADMANATNETDFRTILNDVRGMLFNAMALHEKSEHNGQPCFNERVNSIAWLAHALGLTVDNLQQLGELLSDYEEHITNTIIQIQKLEPSGIKEK